MKAAKLELLGLSTYFSADVAGLHYPLMCVLDYKGVRMIAMSLLPIGRDTIKYGSSDSGATVHADVEEINEKMRLRESERERTCV